MAATIDFTNFRAEDGSNTKRRILGAYTGPASYTTGGDPLVPGDVKLGQIDVLFFEQARNSGVTTIYWPVYHKSADKVLWFSATGTELANATDLSGFVARFEAIGR